MAGSVRVLSIDGGGIRGVIPAAVLTEIERRTDRPAAELFDLIAGTSTGGIIALAPALPNGASTVASTTHSGCCVGAPKSAKPGAAPSRISRPQTSEYSES